MPDTHAMPHRTDDGTPDGSNASLSLAVSPDGTPTKGERYEIPARCGRAVRLRAGATLTLINTHGTQVCDFWAFDAADLREHLSMVHCHTILGVFPKPGDVLVTNRRRPILSFVSDTSPGVHDTVIACCDAERYRQLGVEDYHDNCADNLRMALIAIGLRAPLVPAPFNVWMNIPIAEDGSIQWLPTVSKPGDTSTFRAERDCIAVMSACPQDLVPINGADVSPRALHFEVR